MGLSRAVKDEVTRALAALAGATALGDPERAEAAVRAASFVVERPRRAAHGDFATNAAMVLAKAVGKPPREIAALVTAELADGPVVASAEVAGPGFVNLRVRPSAVAGELDRLLHGPQAFARQASATGERVDLEFVSANPTGPLTVASARNAILGDAVGRLLERAGHRVTREYYVNDFGRQVGVFAASVRAVSEGREVPEDGYKGDYVVELADHLRAIHPDALAGEPAALTRLCVALMLHGIPGSTTLPGLRRTLGALGVDFDVWFSEESLHRWGDVDRALGRLRASGQLEEKDGAVFFVARGDSADKDRVVRKSDGDYTYFASDIAYFADKVSRGYDRLLVVLGADHHGYVARVANALGALGLPRERFEALLYQLVFVYRNGELVRSSKRAGNVVTADEIMDEIDAATGRQGAGRDALRFFFLSRAASSQVDFDVELAKKASLDNPVFYVQYGYARLSSILRRAAELGFAPSTTSWHKLGEDELGIAVRVAEYPDVACEAALLREPHRIVFWVQELAQAVQSYYTRHKDDPILPRDSMRASPAWSASWDRDKTGARLAWVLAIRAVYAEALSALGISAPERLERLVGQGTEDHA